MFQIYSTISLSVNEPVYEGTKQTLEDRHKFLSHKREYFWFFI